MPVLAIVLGDGDVAVHKADKSLGPRGACGAGLEDSEQEEILKGCVCCVSVPGGEVGSDVAGRWLEVSEWPGKVTFEES